MINVNLSVSHTGVFLECGRKPEYLQRTRAETVDNMQTPCRKATGLWLEPMMLLL